MRKSPEQILKELELTLAGITEMVSGRRVVTIRVRDAKEDRPKCLVCGFQVNAKNCKPFHQP